VGLEDDFPGLFRRHGVPFLQLAGQAQHLFPVLAALLGLQLQAHGSDVAAGGFLQLAQGIEGAAEVPGVQAHLGGQHEAGHLQVVVPFRILQPLAFLGVFAQGVGGPGRHQGGEAGHVTGAEGFLGPLHGLAVAAFEEVAQGVLQGGGGLVLAAPFAELADPGGQAQGQGDQAQQAVQHGEGGDEADDQQVEGDFQTPGREHHQHVAVIDPGRQGQADGGGEQGENPEQASHLRSLASFRVFRALRLSLSRGSSMTISVPASCLTLAMAVCTDLSLVLK